MFFTKEQKISASLIHQLAVLGIETEGKNAIELISDSVSLFDKSNHLETLQAQKSMQKQVYDEIEKFKNECESKINLETSRCESLKNEHTQEIQHLNNMIELLKKENTTLSKLKNNEDQHLTTIAELEKEKAVLESKINEYDARVEIMQWSKNEQIKLLTDLTNKQAETISNFCKNVPTVINPSIHVLKK